MSFWYRTRQCVIYSDIYCSSLVSIHTLLHAVKIGVMQVSRDLHVHMGSCICAAIYRSAADTCTRFIQSDAASQNRPQQQSLGRSLMHMYLSGCLLKWGSTSKVSR